MLAAQPQTSYAAVLHRKRVLGDKSADDAARAAAYSRGNRIKLSQVTTTAQPVPLVVRIHHALNSSTPCRFSGSFPARMTGERSGECFRQRSAASTPAPSHPHFLSRDLTPAAHRFSAVEKCVTEIDALPERCRYAAACFVSQWPVPHLATGNLLTLSIFPQRH